MMENRLFGILLEQAPASGQVLPLDRRGQASLRIAGRWRRPDSADLLGRSGCLAEARLVEEATGRPPSPACDWRPLEIAADGTFVGALGGIPSGGPYRLETRLQPRGNKTREWGWRGDRRHDLYAGDVFLIAGQSNAAGYGEGDGQDGAVEGVQAFSLNGEWRRACHPLIDTTDSLWPELVQDHNTGHSPWLAFGEAWRRRTGRPVGFVPMAVGGSSLAFWSPGGLGFLRMASVVEKAGVLGGLSGILWCQGETDAKGNLAEDYQARWTYAMTAWRNSLKQPELPLFAVQLGRYFSRNPGADDEAWSRVREAQRRCSDAVERLYLTPGLDLELSDSIHWSPGANRKVGHRLGHWAAEILVDGRKDGGPPFLREALSVAPDRLRLRFGGVADRLDNADPKAACFTVWRGSEAWPVLGLRYGMDDSVELRLAPIPETTDPDADTWTVSAGHGENPPPLPMDVARRLPILAFHRFPVRSHL